MPAKQASEVNKYDDDTAKQVAQKEKDDAEALADAQKSADHVDTDAQKDHDDALANEQKTLNNDPARTADEQRAQAAGDRDQAIKTASDVQKQAGKDADARQAQGVKKATDTKNASIQEADSTLTKANQNADAQQARDDAASNNKAKSTIDKANQAQKQQTADAQQARDAAITANGKANDNQQVKDAKNAVSKAQGQLDNDQKALNDLNNNSQPAVPRQNITGDMDPAPYDFPKESQVRSVNNLPTTIIDPHFKNLSGSNSAIIYVPSSQDTTDVITGELTSEQQAEITRYGLTLVNSWRSQKGLSPILMTKDGQKSGQAIINWRKQNNYNSQHTPYNDATTQAAHQYGLEYSRENLGFTLPDRHVTMLSLETQLYNVIQSMLYQDAASEWGHRDNFAKMELASFEMQKNTGKFSDVIPYVYVIDGYRVPSDAGQWVDGKYVMPSLTDWIAKNGDTILDSTWASPVAKQRANLKNKVSNDEKSVTNAQTNYDNIYKSVTKQIADANKKAVQTYQDTIKSINAKHDKAVNDAKSTLNQELAQHANVANTTKANAQKAHDRAVGFANNKYKDTIKALQERHDFDLLSAKKTYDATVQKIQDNYKSIMSSLHDETPAERKARHDATYAQFKLEQDKKLTNIKNAEAAKISRLKEEQAKKLQAFKKQRAADRTKLLAQQAQDLKDAPAKAAQELKDFEAQQDADYQALLAKQATDLQNLKDKNAKELANLKAKNQAYLDSIDPSKKTVPTTPVYDPSTGQLVNDKPVTPEIIDHGSQGQEINGKGTGLDGLVKPITLSNGEVAHENGGVVFNDQDQFIGELVGNKVVNKGQVVASVQETPTVTESTTTKDTPVTESTTKDTPNVGSRVENNKHNQLPNTGNNNDSSLLSVMGIALTSLVGLFGLAYRKNER
ncbi:SEC10/PgrA surface exclusion domain-containing protein [Fructilactobacillus sanfranciscensis]|uniref:SEC10/PgrA surface exclusion domain-containing protein n=1 Tax=Fructilactobacillus sanfranciscensis TaxID=1625 RepID=UPI0013D15BC7|nr:SEC10/PgrA surface exclusion domain-containing protein [Fructilactobacillus sanfranciscensis]NDR77499.1 SEC10/PgrA surface exclusion domain-containing protein [Fructilactobacillus sanfranciscensis]